MKMGWGLMADCVIKTGDRVRLAEQVVDWDNLVIDGHDSRSRRHSANIEELCGDGNRLRVGIRKVPCTGFC